MRLCRNNVKVPFYGKIYIKMIRLKINKLPSSSKKSALPLTKLMNLDVMQYLFYHKNFLTFYLTI
jgi:hypothetical protein